MPQMSNKGGSNKQRKYELERQRLIDCGFCPYHRGENANGRIPRERLPDSTGYVKPRSERRRKRGGVREL